ncbi:hypothetical protein [Natrarchaeobius chitinivorans]|uniref:Preprotein translocase subunit TatA n=1 Tax=Natrarchaeobius chitinivorans TaxID=1679083 RepID=A0A3N6LRD5_NATCH|nr:hypothetical protein [Natrarchaeobius chitinivorans]RQG90937.1 hypothetical protein EA473_19305 [Natrarchaeobius chitinivorans]
MVPLFVPGVPGGPELLVILVMLVFYLVIPILVIVAIYNFLDGKRGYESRITALEERVEELESEQR